MDVTRDNGTVTLRVGQNAAVEVTRYNDSGTSVGSAQTSTTPPDARVVEVGAGGRSVQVEEAGTIVLQPTESGSSLVQVVASEPLAAGDLVNIWDNAGTANARRASASSFDLQAHGFVLADASTGSLASIYLEGPNTAATGLSAGPLFLSVTPGKTSPTGPTVSRQIAQRVGVAYSSSGFIFQPEMPVELA